jgi:hypothetical protein
MWRYQTMVCLISALQILSFASACAQDGSVKRQRELIFSATPSSRGVLYKIDGAIVSDPLRGLGRAIEKYGDEAPVVCVIDSRLPIRVFMNAIGIAGKAGFRNIRGFAFDHRTNEVSEIKFGPWSTAP